MPAAPAKTAGVASSGSARAGRRAPQASQRSAASGLQSVHTLQSHASSVGASLVCALGTLAGSHCASGVSVRVDGVRADELICVLLLFLVRVVYLCRLKDGHVLAAPAFLAPAVLSPMLAEAAAAALLAPGAAETAVLAEAGAAAFLAQWY